LSVALIAAMRAAGERVRAHKPVVTGADDERPAVGDDDAWPADDQLLAAAAGMEPHEVAPLRYRAAASPKLAAELEDERIDPDQLVAVARSSETATDGAHTAIVVEGVGGLLVPFDEHFAVRDLAVALGLPLLIAARPGLGTINHTLLTLAAARAARLSVSAVVLTPWPAAPSELERSNRAEIERLGDVEVAVLRGVRGPDLAELERAGRWLPWRRWLDEAVPALAGDADGARDARDARDARPHAAAASPRSPASASR
jgi:dethiobiotin synthetase